MPKRLFIAINLPVELKRGLANVQKEIEGQFSDEFIEAGLFKWVEMENLHLTLRFIGEVGDTPSSRAKLTTGQGQIPKIIENIKNAVEKHETFEIKTAQICYDTENERQLPRLIWLETIKNRELENLAKDLGAEKNWQGHITLARVKEWVFKRIEMEERPSITREFKAKIPVNSIELMESILKRAGPEYKILQSFQFKK